MAVDILDRTPWPMADAGKRAPREAGFSKDADKLIRRLSLVALLLSRRGRPATTAEIRMRVEGYPLMTDEAFKRRFYEDRAELAELGVEIVAEPDPESAGELYSLPGAGYYLPPVSFAHDEIAALAACLFVLEGRFAYSRPLRLALVSLAQGRPELLEEEPAPAVALPTTEEAARAPRHLPKLQAAIADRKSVTFTYYSIGRDEHLERTVDPYGLQLVGDEWYLIARCHLRAAVRTFRLSRIESQISFATRAPHDFAPPADFDIAAYRDRPPWQLGHCEATARVRVDATMAWWVVAHFAHCGVVTPGDDGGILYETPYASPRELVSWVLGLGEAAIVEGPAELRAQIGAELGLLVSRLAAPPRVDAATATELDPAWPTPHPRSGSPDWRVEVDRFTRLTTLASYLLQHCQGDDETSLESDEVCRALGLSDVELAADVRLLNLVNFGGDGTLLFAEFEDDRLLVSCDLAGPALATPARLSPLQVDTLLLAIELVGGQLPVGSGGALARAAQKLRRARHGAAPSLAAAELLAPSDEVFEAVNTAIKDRRLLEIEYWAEGTGETSTRVVEPSLMVRTRGEWYYVSYCRKSEGQRTFRVATTKRARLQDEHFAPRADLELELYRREGIPSTRQYAPRTALLWFSPQVRRWIEERQPVATLPDGAGVTRQPYLDDHWLALHVLRFGGEALTLAPPAAAALLRDVTVRLAARYSDA